jgi:hypothetical protein
MQLPVRKEGLALFSLLAVYLVAFECMIGYRLEHFLLVALCTGLYLNEPYGRKFLWAYSAFILYWIIWDGMKAFPNFEFARVHIRDLYEFEKHIFGVEVEGRMLTPNEWLALDASKGKDFFAGLFYINWVPVPLVFGFYLFVRRPYVFLQFAFCFLLANLIGFVGYYLYPAAPPWYVDHYGFDFDPSMPGNAAGLARFDAIVGAGVFEGLYAKSSNVFAAFPSLHAAYPLVVLIWGIKAGLRSVNLVFGIFALGIWWAAVYSGHHYVVDLLGGIVCALLAWVLLEWAHHRWPAYRNVLERYASLISFSAREQ